MKLSWVGGDLKRIGGAHLRRWPLSALVNSSSGSPSKGEGPGRRALSKQCTRVRGSEQGCGCGTMDEFMAATKVAAEGQLPLPPRIGDSEGTV